jgi:hypothetical protein
MTEQRRAPVSRGHSQLNHGVIMKQRNFVAKHARSCGAGRHTVRTKYSRKTKHRLNREAV